MDHQIVVCRKKVPFLNNTSIQAPGLSCHTSLDRCFTLINGIDSTQSQPLHRQKYYEIQYVVSGQGYVTVNHQKLYLSAGDYVLLLPGDQHSLKVKDSIHIYSIEFSVDGSFPGPPVYEEIQKIFTRQETAVINCKNSSLKSIFDNLFKEWQDRKPMYIYNITLLFQQILILCYRNLQSDSLSYNMEGKNENSILDTFFAFLEAYMDDPDVLTLFEKNYGFKRAVLTQLAKERYNKTIFQLYTEKRFEYALNLLADGRSLISDVARKCAFASVASFSKAFTKHFGMSPSKYVQTRTASYQEIISDIYADFSTCSDISFMTVNTDTNKEKTDTNAVYTNPKLQLL
ncbi:MAG: helix-turn-helix domain-containing protein [Ruminococcaceae bacterium]|nr:helix-turn-helix domain-containing protein [Oscillospiraceae bacterium]